MFKTARSKAVTSLAAFSALSALACETPADTPGEAGDRVKKNKVLIQMYVDKPYCPYTYNVLAKDETDRNVKPIDVKDEPVACGSAKKVIEYDQGHRVYVYVQIKMAKPGSKDAYIQLRDDTEPTIKRMATGGYTVTQDMYTRG